MIPYGFRQLLSVTLLSGIIIAPLFNLDYVKPFALAQNVGAVGEACKVDSDCGTTGRDPDEQIACSVDGICGGKGAFCYYNGNFAGYSDACDSRTCKISFSCQSPTAVGVGQPCSDSTDCSSSTTQCGIYKICGGQDASCTSYDNCGYPTPTGFSTDCITKFCREGRCSNAPVTPLGKSCAEDQDCEGTFFGLPVYCSPLGRCGGQGAVCDADDGTAEGPSEACVSGLCSARICAGPGPSPGVNSPERRQLARQRIFGELCPGNLVPCPVGHSRYKCIDIQNSHESCGGCLGIHKELGGRPAGVDCTALLYAESVSCVEGQCLIEGCSAGATINADNRTCIASG